MNLIFNASAGTGKTWQVTEMYAALVLGGDCEHLPPGRPPVSPEKILLMTFTDNAAAELRARVSSKMIAAEQAALDAGDSERADRARRILRTLPAARISTIHAFCAGLLREYALEAGLSPDFQTLDQEERDALLDEVLRREIFACLENDPDFREFCAAVTVLGTQDHSLIGTIRVLLEKAAGRGLDLSDANALLQEPVRTAGRRDFETIRDELAAYDLPKTAADALAALNTALEQFPDLQLISALRKFGQCKKVKHLSDRLADVKERYLTEALYERHFARFQAFARCLSAAARAFVEAKRGRDSLDFGDQLLLARDFLSRHEFKTPLFDWIIVDEVQDTSRVQCELIRLLCGDSTRLVICGDRKQSIYAWRSADPQVMPDLQKQMEERGGVKIVALNQSRRSKDRVLEAVNRLFGGIYDDYEALEPAAPLKALTASLGEGPCTEFLAPDEPGQGMADEMAAVARRIRLLAEGGPEWRPNFGFNGTVFDAGEPVRYRDILVLLKRTTHQSLLEQALRAAGVPCTAGGKGSALFARQEVRDLLLLLQVLYDPLNDLALAGFMRSPFARLTDETIVDLGQEGGRFDHEILRRRFFESGLDAAERVLRYRAQISRKLPSQIVREMVRETEFDAHWAGQPDGAQKLANVKKALDWLRAAERGGRVLAGDVVRRFEQFIRTPPRSGAAEALLPDPEQDAVTIMTVHGAKGLTSRVCFVPDISFGGTSEPGFALLSSAGRLEMKISGTTDGAVKSLGWEAAREADQAVRRREQDNVFYVAMTRARDLVVLSGAGTKEPQGWLKQAQEFLESSPAQLVRKRPFSELPPMQEDEAKAGGAPAGAAFPPPVKPVAGTERRTVTSLMAERAADAPRTVSTGPGRRAAGSLGHAVLEELAANAWQGPVPALMERLSGEFAPVETGPLIEQIEAARERLRHETAGAQALFAERPFVLKRGEQILDGTIDLLAQMAADAWKIIDYKFTEEPPDEARRAYEPQLHAYCDAVRAMHPGSSVSAALLLIGRTVRLVPVT